MVVGEKQVLQYLLRYTLLHLFTIYPISLFILFFDLTLRYFERIPE
jgi:hypothetical protein